MSCFPPVSASPVSFTGLSNHSDFEFSLPRIKKMLGDEKSALSMGRWDKIKDFFLFFRPERKQDVLKAVYDLMHLADTIDEYGIKSPRTHEDTVRYFNVLIDLANPVDKERFTRGYDSITKTALFFINEEIVYSEPYEYGEEMLPVDDYSVIADNNSATDTTTVDKKITYSKPSETEKDIPPVDDYLFDTNKDEISTTIIPDDSSGNNQSNDKLRRTRTEEGNAQRVSDLLTRCQKRSEEERVTFYNTNAGRNLFTTQRKQQGQ